MCTCILRRSSFRFPESPIPRQHSGTRLSHRVGHRCTAGHRISTHRVTDIERFPSESGCYLERRRLQAACTKIGKQLYIQTQVFKEVHMLARFADSMFPGTKRLVARPLSRVKGIPHISIPICIAPGFHGHRIRNLIEYVRIIIHVTLCRGSDARHYLPKWLGQFQDQRKGDRRPAAEEAAGRFENRYREGGR